MQNALKNMLTRIGAKDPDFDDICDKHAELTAQIRNLNPSGDPGHAQRDGDLRKRRAAVEEKMFAIMQANIRI